MKRGKDDNTIYKPLSVKIPLDLYSRMLAHLTGDPEVFKRFGNGNVTQFMNELLEWAVENDWRGKED